MSAPSISVVVPTRNRRHAVTRLLRSLAGAGGDMPAFDAVVVDDGSTDDTVAVLSNVAWPFPVRLVQQPNSGAAVARNAGARVASGDVLLFLDDDMEASPGLLAAHNRVHGERHDTVAVGDLPPVVDDTRFLGVMLRSWWGAMQHEIRRPGHRYAFTDLLSGHVSIRRARFEQLGGFDERLRCREDYELGYRVVAAGLRLQFVPDAVAWHHDDTSIQKVMRRKFDEGMADVHLLKCHPALASSLPLRHGPVEGRMARRLVRLAWRSTRAGDAAARTLASILAPLEWARMRWKWQGVLNALLSYWYYRGVIQAAGSRATLDALLGVPTPAEPPVTLDLAGGLDAAEARLDALGPRSVRLVFGPESLGCVPEVAGAEPLRGGHLRPLLARHYRREYLRALTAAGRVPAPLHDAAAWLVEEASRAANSGEDAVERRANSSSPAPDQRATEVRSTR